MRFVSWISQNNDLCLNKVREIVSNPDEADDLYQSVVEQLLRKPDKIDKVTDKEKYYFFIRVIRNNYFSKTSPYHYQYRKPSEKNIQIKEDILEQIEDEEYNDELPDMEWVKNELQHLDWFSRDLFLLWLELNTISNVSRQTQIPLNSVSRYINKIKKELKKRWDTR
jgi:RNA polymerase sigma factor (sigma-70 family)